MMKEACCCGIELHLFELSCWFCHMRHMNQHLFVSSEASDAKEVLD
jgi:hypothetical protein